MCQPTPTLARWYSRRIAFQSRGGPVHMESIVGIFNSLTDAKRGAAVLESLGIQRQRISVLAPGTSDAEVEANVLTAESEQPGMGRALGATVGGAMGVAGGLSAGAAAASI